MVDIALLFRQAMKWAQGPVRIVTCWSLSFVRLTLRLSTYCAAVRLWYRFLLFDLGNVEGVDSSLRKRSFSNVVRSWVFWQTFWLLFSLVANLEAKEAKSYERTRRVHYRNESALVYIVRLYTRWRRPGTGWCQPFRNCRTWSTCIFSCLQWIATKERKE